MSYAARTPQRRGFLLWCCVSMVAVYVTSRRPPLPTLLAPQANILESPRCRAARARNGLSEEGLDVLARDR